MLCMQRWLRRARRWLPPAVLVLVPSLAQAIEPARAASRPGDETPPLERISPELQVAPSLDLYERASAHPDAGLRRFLAEAPGPWEVRWDVRSDRPHLVQGAGFPILPGRGNALGSADAGLPEDSKVTLADVEARARAFMDARPDLLKVGGLDLRLDPERSLAYGADSYLWLLEFQQHHQGVPVHDAYVFFRINHGNLVQFGTHRVAEVQIDATPSVSSDQALEGALAELALKGGLLRLAAAPTLVLHPVAEAGEEPGQPYVGAPGAGYGHRLVWEYLYALGADPRDFRLRVDAHTGELLENEDLTRYATVSGKVFPKTNTDPLQQVNFPFCSVTNGTVKVTNAAGSYTYSGGTATALLDGRYIRISDACGSISLSDSSTGNLNFGGVSGTDCTAAGVGGPGNTNAARSGFYHLTNINRKAAGFLPGNAWINGTLVANMNINLTCNAFWSPTAGTVNFYRSGGGCSNTGEIAAVFLHEWGHGMDQNSGGAASEQGSGEAVGDTFAFLETKDGCIGPNFKPGVPCTNCRSSCTGVRDLVPFSNGGGATIARPSTVTSNTGIDCDRFTCPYTTSSGSPYRGPMGYEGHCESYIASTANWDLAQSLVAALGSTAGWARMDAIWYGSLTPSKSAYRLVSGGQCNPSAVVDGCAASNWYTVYLPVDDDDGNLANGTPNGCRIWDAFNAHGIACGSRPACSSPPLVISQQPANRTVTAGGSASFSVAASGGTTPYFYQWQYSTTQTGTFTNLSNGGGISGATTATLTINPATLARAGYYRCRVTDSSSPAKQVFSNAAKLTVNPAPLAISQQPLAANVRAGGTASFTLAATGGVTPYAYQWQYSTTSTGTYTNLANGGGISGATTAALTISSVTASRAGYYRCRVTDSASPASQVFSNAAQLTVSPVLVITTQPVNRTVAEGGSTTLSVAASGVTPFAYQWQYSATSGTGGFTNLVNGNGISGVTGATLTINPASPAHAGWYRCRVTDSGPAPNQVFSNAAKLTITVPPCSPSSTTLCLQGTRFRVRLSAASGTPTVKTYSNLSGFFWLFGSGNMEVGVKILDGTTVNGKWWVFHGSLTTVQYTLTVVDTVAGTQKTYVKAAGSMCGTGDTGAFPPLAAPGQEALTVEGGLLVPLDAEGAAPAPDAVCTANATTVCLLSGRFKVQVLRGGVAQPAVSFTDKTGLFWFFNSANIEVPVKVLDGTPSNGHYWVFFGSLTDQTYQVVVTDTVTSAVKTYNSPAAFCGLADTAAF